MHREARETWDESADLTTLARTPITVVCAGVKSILDVGATLERLETLNVPVLGYGTDRFPGFYLADSGYAAAWRVDSPGEVGGRAARAGAELGTDGAAVVVANPLPPAEQLDPALHDRVLPTGSRPLAGGGVARQGRDAVPARLLPPRDRGREPRGQRRGWCCATRALAAADRGARAPA